MTSNDEACAACCFDRKQRQNEQRQNEQRQNEQRQNEQRRTSGNCQIENAVCLAWRWRIRQRFLT